MHRRRATGLVLFVVVAALALAVSAGGSSTTSPSRCRTWQLHVAPTFYGEAATSFIQTFTFTNASRGACWLRGWPRLALKTPTGQRKPVASWRVVQGAPTAPPFRTVVLRARGAASFDVYGADWNLRENKPCPRTTVVLITPPAARSAFTVHVKMPNCGRFYIAPVIAGKKDRDSWSAVWHK
jgi:hypothetical protein